MLWAEYMVTIHLWGHSSLAEHLLNMREALGSITSTEKKIKLYLKQTTELVNVQAEDCSQDSNS
jgi:hypothetical protein